jgi:hypothetical protein
MVIGSGFVHPLVSALLLPSSSASVFRPFCRKLYQVPVNNLLDADIRGFLGAYSREPVTGMQSFYLMRQTYILNSAIRTT